MHQNQRLPFAWTQKPLSKLQEKNEATSLLGAFAENLLALKQGENLLAVLICNTERLHTKLLLNL